MDLVIKPRLQFLKFATSIDNKIIYKKRLVLKQTFKKYPS